MLIDCQPYQGRRAIVRRFLTGKRKDRPVTNLVGIAYCSRPVEFSFEEVENILRVSQEKNAQAAITGALVYDNFTFLQWLEGDPIAIREVFERLSDDPRHTDIKLIAVRKLSDRLFPDWSMTAAVTNDQELRGLKLVPHISLAQFNPFDWSEPDVAAFMDALSDYLTSRPAPKSEAIPESVSPRRAGGDPLTRLERHLGKIT